jgi:hypothetical protein
MAGTHGDLISEIGKLVVAAYAGEPIDLTATSQDLACRYAHLKVPPDSMARAIARSLSAVGVSIAVMNAAGDAVRSDGSPDPGEQGDAAYDPAPLDKRAEAAAALFPSGVRLTLVS